MVGFALLRCGLLFQPLSEPSAPPKPGIAHQSFLGIGRRWMTVKTFRQYQMKMKKMKWRVAVAQKFVLFASVRLDFFLTSRSAGKGFFFNLKGGGGD